MDKIVWGATAMILSEFELFISDNLKKKYIWIYYYEIN
jgi:hypothetical protein